MSLQKTFKTNDEAMIDVCVNEDGTVARFCIARASRRNKAYTKAMEKATKPFRAILDKLDTKTDDTITATVLAESIVLGWEHLQEEDGVDIPYSPEKAKEILIAYPELADLVNKKAWEMETFREAQLDEDAKN